MSKGLEALEKLTDIQIYEESDNECSDLGCCCDFKGEFLEVYDKEYEIIKKELKALEIIKKKNVDIWDVKYSEDYEHYNLMTSAGTSKNHIHKPITQEEYDLLQEVLL